MQKTVITAFHFLNETWQAYVIGKNYEYLSHMASNLQGRALSGCSSLRKLRHSCSRLCAGSLWRAHYFTFLRSQQSQSPQHVSSFHFPSPSIPLESWGEWRMHPPTYSCSLWVQMLAFAQLWVSVLTRGNPSCLSLGCPQCLCSWRVLI